MLIKSTNLTTSSVISTRTKSTENKYIRSVSILQTDGSFIVSYPFINEVVWYPQSPNNPTVSEMQAIKIFNSFTNYGNLNFPLDAKVDSYRKNVYIADAGNNRVLKVNLNTQSVIHNYDISAPITVSLDLNTDSLFIRSIASSTSQLISYYKNNILIDTFVFDCNGAYPLAVNSNFIRNVPNVNSMIYDNIRNRLWWIANTNVFMFDALNNNIVVYNLVDDGITTLKSIDIDLTSGNAFIVGVSSEAFESGGYNYFNTISQISKDNNVFLGNSYIVF